MVILYSIPDSVPDLRSSTGHYILAQKMHPPSTVG